MQKVCLQTCRKNRIFLKLAYFLRKIQDLLVNNSRILTIKNAKFTAYYFYMNLNIWLYFQICINVPLKKSWFPAAIQYALLKFTYHWCFAHVQLKLWNRKICKIFLLLGNLWFQMVTVLVKIPLLLHISRTLETFHTSSVTKFLTGC